MAPPADPAAGPGLPLKIYIGSADLMGRNLDRRIEVVVPVHDPELQARLFEVLDLVFADETNAWELGPDRRWRRVPNRHGVSSQERLKELARERARRRLDSDLRVGEGDEAKVTDVARRSPGRTGADAPSAPAAGTIQPPWRAMHWPLRMRAISSSRGWALARPVGGRGGDRGDGPRAGAPADRPEHLPARRRARPVERPLHRHLPDGPPRLHLPALLGAPLRALRASPGAGLRGGVLLAEPRRASSR